MFEGKNKCIRGVVSKRYWEVLEGLAPKRFDRLGLLRGLEEWMALEMKNHRFDGVYTIPSGVNGTQEEATFPFGGEHDYVPESPRQ